MSENARPIDDERLVLQCRCNDAQAFEKLVKRWQERLWRHALRLTGNEDAAYDILQETLLAISRDIWRLENPASFRSWAYQIATFKSRDWIRRRVAEREKAHRYAREQARSIQHPGASIHGPDVEAALERLSDDEQLILALRFEEQLTMAEIATVLEINEGTVKSRLHYAKQHLKSTLQEELSHE